MYKRKFSSEVAVILLFLISSGQQILGPPRSKKKEKPHDLTQDIFDEARRYHLSYVGHVRQKRA
jgi:hypothetical protein